MQDLKIPKYIFDRNPTVIQKLGQTLNFEKIKDLLGLRLESLTYSVEGLAYVIEFSDAKK